MTDPGPVSRAPAASVNEVLDLYERWAGQTYDEDLTQIDHALQCAALASAEGADDALVAAALLHDVGHLLDLERSGGLRTSVDTDLAHEATGARYLSGVLPPSVTGPIALHVRAKRYRCAVDPGYHDGLSDGSRASLVLQGGPMTPAEVADFERNPGHRGAVRLRAWDDGGKVDGLDVPGLDAYRPLLDRLATR